MVIAKIKREFLIRPIVLCHKAKLYFSSAVALSSALGMALDILLSKIYYYFSLWKKKKQKHTLINDGINEYFIRQCLEKK